MSANVAFVSDDMPAADAAEFMERDQVRCLPVQNQDNHVVGIPTADDLSWHTDHRLLGEVIVSVYERRG